MMIRKTAIAGSVSLALFAASNVSAQSTDYNDWYYYEIGGSSASHAPSGYRDFALLDANPEFSLNLSCGQFDIQENLEQLFDQFNNLADNLVNILVFAAQSLVNDLPLLILREAWPNLAKLFENAFARYEELIRIAVRDCQASQEIILNGDNYFNDWIKISRGRSWQVAQEEGLTATDAQAAVAAGEMQPVYWIGGEERGIDSPITLISDLVTFGYDELSGGDEPRITQVWEGADAAVEFAQRVIGEIEIVFEGQHKSSPGEGILPSLRENQEEIVEALTGFVENGSASFEELTEISSPTVRITPTFLKLMAAAQAGAREFTINRVANEIATANAAERLILLRRILTTAMREPHVMVTPAHAQLKEVILPELKLEYDFLTDVANINRDFVSNTVQVLIQEYEGRNVKYPTYLGAPDDLKTTEGVILKDQN